MLMPTDEIDTVPPPLTAAEAAALVAAALPGARCYRVRGACAVEVGGNVRGMDGAPLVATGPTWEEATHAALLMVGR